MGTQSISATKSPTRAINWRQFIAAIRDDGYKKGTGTLIRGYGGRIEEACTGGQAGLNLGVAGQDLLDKLSKFQIIIAGEKTSIGNYIVHKNDHSPMTPKQIADALEAPNVKVIGGRRAVKFSVTRQNYAGYSNWRGVTVPETVS